jgi:hypothetical protein
MTALDTLIRRAWPHLRAAAFRGQTITYGELADRVGPPVTRRQVHRQLLTPLADACRRARLPCLAALVVRKDSGMPGAGYGPGRWADDLAACWAFPWPLEPDPRLLDQPARSPENTQRTLPSIDS